MLFWIETDLDFSRLAGRANALLDAEQASWHTLHAGHRLLRIWRRISGRGVHALVDFAMPEALDDWLGALPTFNFMQAIGVTPLRAHKLFSQFATWRQTPGIISGNLHFVRLDIDRARLEAARTPDLVERAEANARRHIDHGQVVGIWRLPHGNGAHMAWASHNQAELFTELDTLPLKGYFRAVAVEPMMPMAGLEALAGWSQTD